MKKGKRLLSLLLAFVIVLTSFSVCFSALADEAQANSDAKVTEAQDAIQAFYDNKNKTDLPITLVLLHPWLQIILTTG